MNKLKLFVAVALLGCAAASLAQTTPTPAAQGAESVQKNLAADISDGQANKGLTTAAQNIEAEHGKNSGDGKNVKGMAEKAERAVAPERPARPTKPERPERPAGR